MSLNVLSLFPRLPGKMLNNNPQTRSAGRSYFRDACPQRDSLRMTAHESTLQRGREKRGSESEAGVTFPFVRQGNSELTCATPRKIINVNQAEFISRRPE